MRPSLPRLLPPFPRRTPSPRCGRAVGRIMGIINRRYNELRQEKNGRFALLECENDRDIAHALGSPIGEKTSEGEFNESNSAGMR